MSLRINPGRTAINLTSSHRTPPSQVIKRPDVYNKTLSIIEKKGIPEQAIQVIKPKTPLIRGIDRNLNLTATNAISPFQSATRDTNRASGLQPDGTAGNAAVYLAQAKAQLSENYHYTLMGDYEKSRKADIDRLVAEIRKDGGSPDLKDQLQALKSDTFSPAKVRSLVPYGTDAREYSLLTKRRYHYETRQPIALVDMDSEPLIRLLKEDPTLKEFIESGQSQNDYSLHRAIALATSRSDEIQGTTFSSRRLDPKDSKSEGGNFALNGEDSVPLTSLLAPKAMETFRLDGESGKIVSEVTPIAVPSEAPLTGAYSSSAPTISASKNDDEV